FSACGGREDLWIREVLPVGWGDTYYQYLPGQSFDITDLPNGTYFIKVIANPGGHLYEAARGNNASLRKVILRGRPGHRRVEVPPWHGIDTEGPIAFRALRELRG
ncbi:MAG: lysyl oxidase family protein, partial [Actinomycetota bacterium]